MNLLFKKLERSPALVRVVPFVVFVGFTFLQGKLGSTSLYWIYFLKTIVGAWLILLVRPLIPEMKWNFSWEGVTVGVAVFALWVGLEGLYPSFDEMVQTYLCPLLKGAGLESWCPKSRRDLPWNPLEAFGANSSWTWMVIAVRILGSSIVVPPLEEVFYRSFLYRYIAKPDFQSMPLGQFNGTSFLVTSAVFGFAHDQWLAGILCAFAYQGLVCWKKRLDDAMTAHAITNCLLGLWVIWKGAWNFW